MSLQHSGDPWSKLVAAAREVRDPRDTEMPYGFSTRVAAQAFAHTSRGVSLWERLALRAVGVASLLAIASAAFNYNAISVPAPGAGVAVVETELISPTDDTVAIVLDFAD